MILTASSSLFSQNAALLLMLSLLLSSCGSQHNLGETIHARNRVEHLISLPGEISFLAITPFWCVCGRFHWKYTICSTHRCLFAINRIRDLASRNFMINWCCFKKDVSIIVIGISNSCNAPKPLHWDCFPYHIWGLHLYGNLCCSCQCSCLIYMHCLFPLLHSSLSSILAPDRSTEGGLWA